MTRVLVVDDVADNRALIADILEDQGYACLQAENGEAALEIVRQEALDLVLLDILMPGISGIEVCRRLRATDLTHSLPVIMVSALGEDDRVVEALDAGANDYVSKPIVEAVLLARIRSILRTHALAGELRVTLDELARKNIELDEYASLIAHDLQAPLRYIRLCCERLTAEDGPEGASPGWRIP